MANEKLQNLTNTPDTTAEFDQADIQANKIMGILAYLSWLVFIPIFAAKNSKFARFHANQGLVLLIAEAAWGIVYGITSAIMYRIAWWLGGLFSFVGIVSLVFVLLMVLGIINASKGKAKELPVIGKIRILK